MGAEEQGIENIWQISIATLFFLAVLSAMFVAFDAKTYEASLFSQEFFETLLLVPQDSTLTLKNIPEGIEISKNDEEIVVELSNNDQFEKSLTLERNLSINGNGDSITIITS